MKKTILIWVIFFVCLQGFGQQVTELSLEQAQELAIKNNHQYQGAILEKQKSESQVKLRRSARLPQANLGLGLTHNLINPVTILPGDLINQPGKSIPVQFGTKWTNDFAFNVRMDLINPTTKQEIQIAQIIGEKTVVHAEMLKKDLRIAVSTAYYNVLISTARSEQQETDLLRFQKNLADVTAMTEAGLLNVIEIERFKNSVTNMEASIRLSKRMIDFSRQTLNYYLGLPSDQEVILTEKILSETETLEKHPLERSLELTNLPAYNLTELSVTEAEEYLTRQKNLAVPTLFLHGAAGTQALGNNLKFFGNQKIPWFFSAYVGIGINWNINTLWENRYTIPMAEIGLRQAKLDQSSQSESLRLEFLRTKNELTRAIENIDVSKNNLSFAQKELEYIKIRFEGELALGKELIEAENKLQSYKDDYWISVYVLHENTAAFYNALGDK